MAELYVKFEGKVPLQLVFRLEILVIPPVVEKLLMLSSVTPGLKQALVYDGVQYCAFDGKLKANNNTKTAKTLINLRV